MNRNLTTFLEEEPANHSAVLKVFSRVLQELSAIHAAGISHLPLAPETIQLDEAGKPHIRYLNRSLEHSDTVAFKYTKYSAPEVFIEGGERSSCETLDCYVLGFVFYEILIGKRLFREQFEAVEKGPSSAWLKWHADKTAKARPLSELRPNLGQFANLIDGMMEKNPSRRMRSITQALNTFLEIEDQTNQPVDMPARGFDAAQVPDPDATVLRPRSVPFKSQPSPQGRSSLTPWLVTGVAVLAICLLMAAWFIRQPRRPAPKLPKIGPTQAAVPKMETKPAPPAPPVTPAEEPAKPQSELQYLSHLKSPTVLMVDDSAAVDLAAGVGFTTKLETGAHKLRIVAGPKSSILLQFDLQSSGDISFIKPPEVESVRCIVITATAESAKLYGFPVARVSDRGLDYDALPDQGQVIARDQVVTVASLDDAKTDLRMTPGPPGSVRIVLLPPEDPVVPVEISANVPDAVVVIQGSKAKHTLENGATVVRLPPGKYKVKLTHANYGDSETQTIIVNAGDQQQQLKFTLTPIEQHADKAASGVPAAAAPMVAEEAKPPSKITFHVTPSSAQIVCRRESDSLLQNCINDQPCLLPVGRYEVNVQSAGYKTLSNRITIGPGEDKQISEVLEVMATQAPHLNANAKLNPKDLFENGDSWTSDTNGWWSYDKAGYSFMVSKQKTLVFEIQKHKKVTFVVNYRGDADRVLYTLDDNGLRRSEKGVGVQSGTYTVARDIPSNAVCQLKMELSPDRVVIRSATGEILDTLPLASSASAKVGFSGKVTLRVVQTGG